MTIGIQTTTEVETSQTIQRETIQGTVTNNAVSTDVSLHSWLTMERVFYAFILLLAAGIRFFGLTNQLFYASEAAHSWAAWLVASGQQVPMEIAPESALLYALHTTLFVLFGGSDFVARLAPALCGIGTVWLLWFWRSWLGQKGALIAALLVAIDPWLLFYSRLADSVALTTFLGLLTLTALLQLSQHEQTAETLEHNKMSDDFASDGVEADDRERDETTAMSASPWQQCAAIAFGLLIVSGPQMWNWLLVIALFAVFALPWVTVRRIVEWPRLWLIAGLAALLGATSWFAHPAGLSALSTSLSVWLQSWTAGEMPYPLSWFWIRLVTDQPLIILFGLIGFTTLRRRVDQEPLPAPLFFLSWLLFGLVLLLLPGRSPAALAMIGLPLLFLAANGLAALWSDIEQGVAWRENSILTVILTILFVSGSFWLAGFSNNTVIDSTLARTLALIGFLMILLVVAYALWVDGRQARLVALSIVGLILFAWTVSSTWALNHQMGPLHPDGFLHSATDSDVGNLVDAVTMLSAQRHGDPGELALQVQMEGVPDPVLGWYLRDMRNLEWVLAPGAASGVAADVIITLAGNMTGAGLTTNYLGSSYALREQWLPSDLIRAEVGGASTDDSGILSSLSNRISSLWTARIRNLLRWMLYHKVTVIPPGEQVILWVASSPEGTP